MPNNVTNTGKKDPLFRLSANAIQSLRVASVLSSQFGEKRISLYTWFVAILLNPECLAYQVLESMEISPKNVVYAIVGKKDVKASTELKEPIDIHFTSDMERVLRKAYVTAGGMGHVYVGTEHLFLAFLTENLVKINKLAEMGLTYDSFLRSLGTSASYPPELLAKPTVNELKSIFGDNIYEENLLGDDLVELARQGRLDPVIGRDNEIHQLINVLSRRNKNNPIIVGDAGVGKTVLVQGLAQKIANGLVHPSMKNVKIFTINIASIIAGSKMRGDVEEKILTIIEQVEESKNSIIFIDDIQNIVIPNVSGSYSDIASVLKPALLKGDFRCIGAIDSDDYSMYFEPDKALSRRFKPIMLKELSVTDTTILLSNLKPILEKHHNILIEDKAIPLAASLSDRYITDRCLPDKAIDVLDEACATKKLSMENSYKDMERLKDELAKISFQVGKCIIRDDMEQALELQKRGQYMQDQIRIREMEFANEKKLEYNKVNGEDIRRIVSITTGIPLNTLGTEERNALLKLQKTLGEKIIGQNEACEAVAASIRRARTGILDNQRPWASFLFLGPTGVGKTELAKVLTKQLFGNEDNLIQIDMSEMMEMHSVSKLIGSPPGYVGFQEGGWLTEKVRKKPHSVILFDEVEKAHPDVLNILLQILEYGHLMDGRGQRVDFKNTIVILTSNIGVEEIKKDKVLGFSNNKSSEKSDEDIDKAYSSMKTLLIDELREELRPELLNRLDDIVIFRSLTRKDMNKIVLLLIDQLNERLEEEHLHITLDNRAVSYIVKKSFNEEYGARPLRRELQSGVENLIADYILKNDYPANMLNLNITVKNNNLVIE